MKLEIFAESGTHSNILDMVAYGMGLALVPRMQQLKERHDLAALTIQDEIPPRAIYLVWAEDAAFGPEIEALRKKIVEQEDLFLYL